MCLVSSPGKKRILLTDLLAWPSWPMRRSDILFRRWPYPSKAEGLKFRGAVGLLSRRSAGPARIPRPPPQRPRRGLSAPGTHQFKHPPARSLFCLSAQGLCPAAQVTGAAGARPLARWRHCRRHSLFLAKQRGPPYTFYTFPSFSPRQSRHDSGLVASRA